MHHRSHCQFLGGVMCKEGASEKRISQQSWICLSCFLNLNSFWETCWQSIDFTTNFLPDLQFQVWDAQFAKKMIARVQGFFTAFSEEPHVPPFPTTTLIFDFWLSDLISGDVDELTTTHWLVSMYYLNKLILRNLIMSQKLLSLNLPLQSSSSNSTRHPLTVLQNGKK